MEAAWASVRGAGVVIRLGIFGSGSRLEVRLNTAGSDELRPVCAGELTESIYDEDEASSASPGSPLAAYTAGDGKGIGEDR